MAFPRQSLIVFFFAWAFGSFSVVGWSQTVNPNAGTRVTAVWMTGSSGQSSDLLVSTGDRAPTALLVGRANRGKPAHIELVGEGPIRLFLPAPVAVAPGTKPPAPVAVGEVALPAGPRGGALLLVLAAGPGNRIRGVALGDDTEAFPVGTVRVANFTNGSVLMRLDRQVETLSSGISRAFPYARLGDPAKLDAPSFPFALARENAVFFNGRIDAWSGSRTLVLVAPGATEDADPVVRSLIDRPPAKAPIDKKP